MRWPVTNSARSHQCEPMSAKAREAPPSVESTRQLSSSGSRQPVLQVGAVDEPDGPRRAGAHAVAGLAHRGVVAVDERDRGRGARRGGRLDQPRAPAASVRQRLLADDVLAGGQRGLGERLVEVVGGADVHHVDVGALDQRLRGLEGALGAERPCGLLGAGRRGGGDADDARPGQACGAGVDGADEAGAGDRDSEWCGHVADRMRTLIVCQAEVDELGSEQRSVLLWSSSSAAMALAATDRSTPILGAGSRAADDPRRRGGHPRRPRAADRPRPLHGRPARGRAARARAGLRGRRAAPPPAAGRRPCSPSTTWPASCWWPTSGATHSRLAVSDLAGAPLTELALDMDIADGPDRVLDVARRALHRAAREGRARPRRTCAASASASPARSRSRRGSRSTRRSCPAGTASRSRTGSRTATRRRCWSTTT